MQRNRNRCRAVIYHADFTPMLAQVRDVLPDDVVLIQVGDHSGNELLPGALDFEAALAEGSPEAPVAVTPMICTSSTPAVPPACPRPSCGASTTFS